LSYETSWQELKDHMRQAGNVNSATILNNAQGKSAGCAVVVFQKPGEATRAIRELQESDLNGRPIKLREDQKNGGANGAGVVAAAGRGGGGGGRGGRGGGRLGGRGRGSGRGGAPAHDNGESSGLQVFVANLSYDTSWQDLKDHFKQCGEVERANTRRGTGTVRFTKKEDAQTAVDTLNGVELQGRALEVRLDQMG
jgi:RNA recognition motif-containing protein